MAIDMYDLHDAQRMESAAAAYVSDPSFSELEKEAHERGFRKATIREINASATSEQFAIELFSWRGGLWAKV